MNDHLFGKVFFIRFTVCFFRKFILIHVYTSFLFGFEGEKWYLFVLIPDPCYVLPCNSPFIEPVSYKVVLV